MRVPRPPVAKSYVLITHHTRHPLPQDYEHCWHPPLQPFMASYCPKPFAMGILPLHPFQRHCHALSSAGVGPSSLPPSIFNMLSKSRYYECACLCLSFCDLQILVIHCCEASTWLLAQSSLRQPCFPDISTIHIWEWTGWNGSGEYCAVGTLINNFSFSMPNKSLFEFCDYRCHQSA
jgi:hypothetical protein